MHPVNDSHATLNSVQEGKYTSSVKFNAMGHLEYSTEPYAKGQM